MRFADVIGNSTVVKALTSMADSGRIAHAMLLYENEGCGALPLALSYIQYLNCENPSEGDSCGECQSCRQMAKLIHPDVHFVFPVNKGPKSSDDKPVSDSYIKYWRELALADPYFREADLQKAIGIESKTGLIAVAEAKSIIGKLSLASVADGYKAVVFYLPEKMNQETANRLLKLVEEPPEKTLFLFITHAPEKVLQTIFSRCQSVRVMPLSKEEAAQVKALNPSLGDQFAYTSEGLKWQFKRQEPLAPGKDGKLGFDQIIDLAMKKFTEYGSSKSATFILGKKLLGAIQKIDYSLHKDITMSDATAWGVKATKLVTVFGTINLVHDPMLDHLGMEWQGGLIDDEGLVRYYMKNEDNKTEAVEGEEAKRQIVMSIDCLCLKGYSHIWVDGSALEA